MEYNFIETIYGIDIHEFNGYYYADLYDAKTEKSVELVNTSLDILRWKITEIQAENCVYCLEGLKNHFGITEKFNLYDVTVFADKIFERYLKAIRETMENIVDY